MTDQMPDRLSVNPNSPHYNEQLLLQGVGIRFNGEVKTNVEEYLTSCVIHLFDLVRFMVCIQGWLSAVGCQI